MTCKYYDNMCQYYIIIVKVIFVLKCNDWCSYKSRLGVVEDFDISSWFCRDSEVNASESLENHGEIFSFVLIMVGEL